MDQLQVSPYGTFIQGYTKQNFSQLADSIFETNEPKLILLFLHLLRSCRLDTEMKEVLEYMLKAEWEFLEANLSAQEFIFFFWYSYLFDLDQVLLSASAEAAAWLAKATKELSLYHAMKRPVYDKQLLQAEVEQFRASSPFSQADTEAIIQKVQKDAVDRKNRPKIQEFKNALYVMDESILKSYCNAYGLTRQTRGIALCEPGESERITGYVEAENFLAPSGKLAFIMEQTVRELEGMHKPQVIKAYKPKELAQDKSAKSERKGKSREDDILSFNWPSTEASETTGPAQKGPALNENSDLKKLGYQITGLTRGKRWNILQQAVPRLGLKRVAHLIAYNVRLRKGQKNSISKYQYAITEWEHDLERLKKTYYKRDFTWPQT
ncbi:hypothetical protein [Ectobacillus ponti]|uniref:Uncharacterized protein n=1 Tax=Ectobacillus ponti TaxID=2961894 RepID=A0AA42BUV1_9BACI|nr:hypothetical protein [Ectobacillus ponti]MCP8970903.1 hypothetical protein [Ectobacillus ponti]